MAGWPQHSLFTDKAGNILCPQPGSIFLGKLKFSYVRSLNKPCGLKWGPSMGSFFGLGLGDVGKKCCPPSQQTKDVAAIKPSATATTPEGEPGGSRDGDQQDACCQALSHCSHPQQCALRGLRMGKHRILAPDS